MSDYRLTIVRLDVNPKYDPVRHGTAGWPVESPLAERQVLVVELTEEEWRRVKRAVMEEAG